MLRHRAVFTGTALLVWSLLVVWLAAACTGSVENGVTQPGSGRSNSTLPAATSPTPTVMPVAEPSVPTISPTATPAVSDATGLIGGPPSQSPEDAGRDGVNLAVASLSFTDRVDIMAETNVRGRRWVLSRFPGATRPYILTLGYELGSVDPRSSELLELEGETILRSVPMPGSPATWLAASGDTIYAGRIGDGGYPDTTVVRVDLVGDEVSKLWVPFSYRAGARSTDWDVVAPSTAPVLLQAILDASKPDRNETALTELDDAIDAAATVDPTAFPLLALSRSQCVKVVTGHVFDFGTQCVSERNSPATDDVEVVFADGVVPGSLVGAGWMSPKGPTFAALVRPPDSATASESPLLFVDINDPSIVLDTGVNGWTEGSQVTQVSFFDGGFIVTTAVDQGVRVDGYNSRLEPLPIFASPTDRDLGYPPDPFISHASISPDGQQLATAQRDWPAVAGAQPGAGLAVIITDSNNGEEAQRVEFDLELDEFVQWFEFDGQWVVMSFRKMSGDAALQPVMIDITTGEIYPLGFEHPAHITFERRAAPDEPRIRVMTPGPYVHGQTVTLRMTPGELLFQHGERLADHVGAVQVCQGAYDFAPCVQLPVTRSSAYGEVPIEVDVTISQRVGHRTTGDIVEDTSHDCVLGGCVLRIGTTTIPIDFLEQATPEIQRVEVGIDDRTATVQIESALFDEELVILVCFTHGSDAEAAHRASAGRVPFCTDMARVGVTAGQAQAEIALREDLASACAIGECSVYLFFE